MMNIIIDEHVRPLHDPCLVCPHHRRMGTLQSSCTVSAHTSCLHPPSLSTHLVRHTLQDVASISAGNDEFIGEMIADALDKVGSNGVLSIESSNRFVRPSV